MSFRVLILYIHLKVHICTCTRTWIASRLESMCAAVRCVVLQSIAVYSSVLKCGAMSCSVLRCVTANYTRTRAYIHSVLQCVAVCCSVSQYAAMHRGTRETTPPHTRASHDKYMALQCTELSLRTTLAHCLAHSSFLFIWS